MSLRDNLVRGTGPRVLIRAWHQQETLAKGAARAQRLIGGRASIEFFFAFDSPYSAVSLAPLLEIRGGLVVGSPQLPQVTQLLSQPLRIRLVLVEPGLGDLGIGHTSVPFKRGVAVN